MTNSDNQVRLPILIQLVCLFIIQLFIYLDYNTRIAFTGVVVQLYSFAILSSMLVMIAAPIVVLKECFKKEVPHKFGKISTALSLSAALLFSIGRASQ